MNNFRDTIGIYDRETIQNNNIPGLYLSVTTGQNEFCKWHCFIVKVMSRNYLVDLGTAHEKKK